MHYKWWTKQNQEENWNCNPSFSANSLSSVLLSVFWESLFWTGKSPPSFFQSTDTESCPVVFLGGKLRTLSASLLAGSRREVKQEMTKKSPGHLTELEKPTQSSDTNIPDNTKTAMPKHRALFLLSATWDWKQVIQNTHEKHRETTAGSNKHRMSQEVFLFILL